LAPLFPTRNFEYTQIWICLQGVFSVAFPRKRKLFLFFMEMASFFKQAFYYFQFERKKKRRRLIQHLVSNGVKRRSYLRNLAQCKKVA